MIEVLFLMVWTLLFMLIAYLSWIWIKKHFKVYLLMMYNWLYLTGIFLIYPKL